MDSEDLQVLLTVEDVCEICQVSRRTVRRWIADGKLPAYRLGDYLIRIRPEDINAMLRRIPNARTGEPEGLP